MRCEYASHRRGVKSNAPRMVASTCDDGGMSGFGGAWPGILERAIEASRKVLRELDGAEIPSGVQRVAAYQGGRLPPPLAARLLRELDENDWFRERVGEEWNEAASDPSTLFLLRPPGWWLELADRVARMDDEDEQAGMAALERRLADTEARRREAVKRLKEGRREVAAAAGAARRLADEAREAAERRLAAEIAELGSLRIELVHARDGLRQLERERHELQEAYGMLRSRLARIRRGREPHAATGRTGGSPPSDPVGLARMLDLQAAELGRHHPHRVTLPPPRHELAIAPGVRPDAADGIDWLLGLEIPVTVLVDGYNVQFHIDRDDFMSGRARHHLVSVIERLRRKARAQHRFVIVYDSTLPGERDARTSTGGVEIRFAEADRIADEEIIELAGMLDRVVVVTSDREVREGSEDGGAAVLWSEALEAWVRR